MRDEIKDEKQFFREVMGDPDILFLPGHSVDRLACAWHSLEAK